MSLESSFPIPLKYIDVVRRTNTALDVLQEGHIYDYWNVDGDRQLSGPWTGFTQFTFLKNHSTSGTCVVRDKIPKLDNARRLRGIYYIDPEDMEFKETMKHARKKLELQMDSAMPCKSRQILGNHP